MSLICGDDFLSDDESQERCFPMPGEHSEFIPAAVRTNRDFSDLMWALVCRNCSYAIDADGFCTCTNNKENTQSETSTSTEPPKKRKLTAVVDLTNRGKPKVIDFMKK
jgi:hypothetical protein